MIQTKFVFANDLAILEEEINKFLNEVQNGGYDILDIKYQDGGNEEIIYYTALIIYEILV